MFGIEAGFTVFYVVTAVVTCVVLQQIAVLIHNVFFHPLRNLPGPTISRLTKLPMVVRKYKGSLVRWLPVLHEQYGDAVRIAPNEVSFTNPQAWKDIYGFRTGGKQTMIKDPLFYGPDVSGGQAGLFRADDTSHGRQRRVLSHAFSERALVEQEPIIEHYASLMIRQLRDLSREPNNKISMETWYNYTTFDIMADLCFGEPLGLLEDQSQKWFLDNVLSFFKLGSKSGLLRYYPLVERFLKSFLIPKELIQRQARNNRECLAKVDRRMEKNVDKSDIWGLVMKQEGEKAMSRPQMYANAISMMTAGTETTATASSGLTFYLLRHPHKMNRLTTEIRSAFKSENDISMKALSHFEYLNACIEEVLRIYPPISLGAPRIVPETGANVCGIALPAGTCCYVSTHATHHSERNFREPSAFIPERWIKNTGYDNDRKDAFQPFSYGPRNCLGKNLAYHEMRMIMARVLWNFDMELCPESEDWLNQDVHIIWEKGPLMVRLTDRRVQS